MLWFLSIDGNDLPKTLKYQKEHLEKSELMVSYSIFQTGLMTCTQRAT